MSVFGVTGRAKVPAVPVVPGPGGLAMACVACTGPGPLLREVHGGNDLALCFDFRSCAARYRAGASPAAYAASVLSVTL